MTLINYLIVGAAVFSLGVYGVLTRRNIIFVFMSLELMFGGVGITLVAFSRYLPAGGSSSLGQVFFLFILAVAAAETALGLGIFLALSRRHQTLEADKVNELKG